MVETCMSKNIDENTLVKGFKFGSRPYVFNPKYCTSTTLPLYFYFGYQIWQASQKKKKCGQVSYSLLLILIFSIISFFKMLFCIRLAHILASLLLTYTICMRKKTYSKQILCLL